MKKRGFTLVELLAVIIILAVIALIATPLVLNVVDSAKKSAWESSAYGIIEAVKMNSMDEMLDGKSMEAVYDFPTDEVDIQGEQPKGGQASVNKQGKVAIAIHNEKWCALKDYDDAEITLVDYDGECTLGMEVTTPGDDLDEEGVLYYSFPEETSDGFMVDISGTIVSYTGTATDVVIPSSVTLTQPVYYEYDLDECVTYYKTDVDTEATDDEAKKACYQSIEQDDPEELVELGYATKKNGYVKYSNIEFDSTGCTEYFTLMSSAAYAASICTEENMGSISEEEMRSASIYMDLYYQFGVFTATRETVSHTGSKTVDIKMISNIRGNSITSITIPSGIEYIASSAFNKSSSSNTNLTSIINQTGKSFDWTSITGSSTANQTFETGTITHENGNITVTAE